MTTNQETLWQKIVAYPIDDPHAAFPFSKKLAQQQHWSDAHAQRVIVEYKKFMFLCIDSPNGASPSNDVDEVWHLHLTYSTEYAQFCATIAGKFIHHHPSKGGVVEHERHKFWHEETLKNYMLAFDELPPTDIWTVPDSMYPPQYLSEKSAFRSLESTVFDTNWEAMPHDFKIAISLLAGCAVWIGVLIVNPFGLNGQDFLKFIAPTAAMILYFLYMMTESFKEILRGRLTSLNSQFSTYHLAYLIGGESRLFQTSVLQAANAQVLSRAENGKDLEINQLVKIDTLLRGHILRYNLETYEDKTVLKGFLQETTNCLARHIQRDFDRFNLLKLPTDWQTYVFGGFIGFMVLRIVQGIATGHSIGFLILTAVIFTFIGRKILFSEKKQLTFFKDYFEMRYLKLPEEQRVADQYALEGRAALATADLTSTALVVGMVATDWDNIDNAQGKEGSNSFSCGGSACGGGGGGCSGGGCGGGCGGCGGCGG